DLACGCVTRPGKGAQSRRPLSPAREGPDALDCLARTGVRGSFRLEQRQHPLGAIGSPESNKAAVFIAQRHPTTSARRTFWIRLRRRNLIRLPRFAVSRPCSALGLAQLRYWGLQCNADARRPERWPCS